MSEESDETETKPPCSLESFRFQGAAKRRKVDRQVAPAQSQEGASLQEDDTDEGMARLAPPMVVASTPLPAIGKADVETPEAMRYSKQLLRNRLPPSVRPFGNKGGTLHVGTSGWDYKHWKGPVYPEKMAKKDWFKHYCSLFDTVEINNTFYRLPPSEVFQAWKDQAPEGFLYALKFSRFGSHMKKLSDPIGTVGLFLERSSHLGGSLQGPVLVQLPPRFRANAVRLDDFLQQVPNGARWTVEMRDPSWLCEEVYGVLKKHKAALCIHDHKDVGTDPHPQLLTADWTYVRYHGPGGDYRDGYDRDYLRQQAEWIRGLLSDGKDVYAYFNNDLNGHAFLDAQELRAQVNQAS